MKKGNLEHWKNIPECTNLLLFSQLVSELLFDYSIPSNRVSTLNSHYLCLDALSAIKSIDYDGVPEGTLKPIMEELYSVLSKDPVFDRNDDSPLNYFVKYQGDRYSITSKVADMNFSDLKKTAVAIQSCYFIENRYYVAMKKIIIEIIVNNQEDRQRDLFRLIKSLLTELMNMGYTLRYIYEVMKGCYWTPEIDVTSGKDIERFFKAFPLEAKTFEVVFKVNKKRAEKLVTYIDNMEIVDELPQRSENHKEKSFLNKKNKEGFIKIEYLDLDPYACIKHVKENISIQEAFYRLFDHNYRFDINTVDCGVYEKDEFSRGAQDVRPVDHTKTMSTRRISESFGISNLAFESILKNGDYSDLHALINAVRFHAHSLSSSAHENQLLDLWAIFESTLDISNKHTSDRIQQVCMYLIPILKRRYIYSLFSQLALDIKKYNADVYEEIIEGNCDEATIVQKICEFTLLEEKKADREQFLRLCQDFPLLKERIEYYSEVLGSTRRVFEFVDKHGVRVKWQIMRIYRNRNLIIHNASTMPYLGLLIENLHSYVDDFLLYLINTLSKGHSIDSMCQDLFIKECQWNSIFQKNNRALDAGLISKMLSM